MIRILLADDHTVVREGLAAIIDRGHGFSVVAQAANGRDAVQMFSKFRPDVSLIDLRMPVMDGVTAIQAIRSVDCMARIIILTTWDGDEDIYRGLGAGARGYLLKDISPDQLICAIRSVKAGGREVPSAIAQKLMDRGRNDELSGREQEVLGLVVKGKTNLEIATELSISESTVKFHVNHILTKLGVADRTCAVVTALKRGLSHL